MRKAIVMMLLAIVSSTASATAGLKIVEEVRILAPTSRLLHFEEGLRSDKVVWVEEPFSDAMIRALPKEIRAGGGRTFIVTKVDLNGDGKPEYLVFYYSSGSGGSEYAIMQESKKGWRNIGWIQGGFNIPTATPSPKGTTYTSIETWSRHGGDIFHAIWNYRNGSYKQTGITEWPHEFSRQKPPFDDCCIKVKKELRSTK